MAGLAPGGGACDGLAFRIPEDRIEEETERLWRRECVAPAYLPKLLTAATAQGAIPVLAFVADATVPDIQLDLPRSEQVRMIRQGTGFLGSSRDYLCNLVEGLRTVGVTDAALEGLLEEVDAPASGPG